MAASVELLSPCKFEWDLSFPNTNPISFSDPLFLSPRLTFEHAPAEVLHSMWRKILRRVERHFACHSLLVLIRAQISSDKLPFPIYSRRSLRFEPLAPAFGFISAWLGTPFSRRRLQRCAAASNTCEVQTFSMVDITWPVNSFCFWHFSSVTHNLLTVF